MSDTPDHRDRASDSVSEPHADPPHHSRTAAAGRDFIHALAGDLRDTFATLGAALGARTARAERSLAAGVARLERSLDDALARPARRAEAARAARAARSSGAAWAQAGGRVLRGFGIAIGVIAAGGALAFAIAMVWALNGLPLDRAMNGPDAPTLVFAAADGTPLGRVGPLRTTDTPLKDFSPTLIKAVVSIEDRRFFQHFGVDPLGILRAAHRNVQAGGIEEGGSTITQQLVKMRFDNRERTYTRKLREALTAVWLETHLGKEQILTRYLNTVYLGAGTYGMTAAAWLYFDKKPADLTLAECAMLAGLIRAPTQYNPLAHLDAARTRATTVLDTMVETGAIDAKAAAVAKANPATIKSPPELAPAHAWFTDWVAPQAAALADATRVSVHVRTTLRPDMQRLAQDALNKVLTSEGRERHVSQGALVAMRPDGTVLAMVGGRDYGASQYNRAVEALRSPGSSFKLFVYLTALRNGYSPDDTISASAIDIRGWTPENYGNEHYGRLTLVDAFAHSVNTAAVRLAMDVGLKNVIATARDLGIDTPISATPSLALGAYGVNLLEMTGAFASVQADRMHVQPHGVAAIGGDDGAALQPVTPPAPTGTLDPYQQPMIELLRGVVDHGTGRGAALDDGSAAGKTGTSQDYRDAWFIGFNDKLIVGVWVGNDDNSPMRRVTGGSLPAQIWKQFMTAATPLVQPESTPVAAAPQTAQTDGSAAATQASAEQPAGGACDPQACGGVYRSFRASDCTYQPYSGGQRRLCELGTRRASAAPPQTTGAAAAGSTGEQAQCHVDACSRIYSSFDPADCTYQPYGGGPRQLCPR
jgi:1A family penicillin-binding protein